MDDNRRQPAFIVAILAFLGATSLPQFLKTQSGGTPPPGEERKDTTTRSPNLPGGEDKQPDRRDLKPFLEYLSEGEATKATGKDLRAYIDEQLTAIYGFGACQLSLMPAAKDVKAIPTAGRNLIVLAAISGSLHFRIFDSDGNQVVDVSEVNLQEHSRQIDDLRKQLQNLWPPHELNRSEKVRVIKAVTSIVGHRDVCEPSIHSLVITLPDPVESAVSVRFDEYFDVVQRAVELQGFILDRSSLPWQTTDRTGAAAQQDRMTRVRDELSGWEVTANSTTPQESGRGRPGLVVFKSPLTNTKPRPVGPPRILLAFVVPESPIYGIDKAAFARSLKLIDDYFYDKLTPENEIVTDAQGQRIFRDGKPVLRLTGRRVLHIIAPNFDGSQRSLETALGAAPREGKHRYHFRVLSNNAGRIDQAHLQNSVSESGQVLTFRSMVHRSSNVLRGIRDFLRTQVGYDGRDLAILIESNSGVPQADARGLLHHPGDPAAGGQPTAKGQDDPEDFIFPLQVSEIRKAYVKRGLLRSDRSDAPDSPERLPIPPDEGGTPQDLPRAFTPESSAALDEMALTQILTTISHRRYRAVGIIASNPFDVVFLARRVRRFCPNLRVFTTQADLLFARPQNATDLRGMLVASTYSLYPPNQWIITSYGVRPHVLFSNQGAQGLYNAITAHLWEMGVAEDHSGPQLLEFAPPYETTASVFNPQLWIGVVGERGLFPLRASATNDDLAYLYNPKDTAEKRWPSQPPDQPKFKEQNLRAMRPNAHLLYWLIWLILVSTCFALAGLTWAYARWATDPRKTKLKNKIPFAGLGHMLRSLNIEVKDTEDAETSVELPSLKSVREGRTLAGFFKAKRTAARAAWTSCVSALAGVLRRPGTPAGASGVRWGAAHAHVEQDRYDPQAKYSDPSKNPCPPRLGAGIYLWLANVLAATVASYAFSYMLVGMKPHRADMHFFQTFTYYLTLASWVLIVASAVFSAPLAGAEVLLGRLNKGQVPFEARYSQLMFVLSFLVSAVVLSCFVIASDASAEIRLDFERTTNLPSGVSPLFPVLFLAGSLAVFISSQLTRRRLYRLSYLSSTLSSDLSGDCGSESQRLLSRLRQKRENISQLIVMPLHAAFRADPMLLFVLFLLLTLFLLRLYYRGPAGSFEGRWFDYIFCSAFVVAAVLIIVSALHLHVLWRETRSMLRLTVELPMAQAFDRIPERLKGWFFGQGELKRRKQLVVRQSVALRERSTDELAHIFTAIFPGERDWNHSVATLRNHLNDPEGTLDSTRSVYPFLDRIWDALAVEDVPRRARSANKLFTDESTSGQVKSSPLMPKDRPKISEVEHAILHDWVRMAEDLVALQIVRWFAPALSQLLPIMQYLVIGSLLLLLALTSYPFDHQGWMMIVIITIILFVVAVISIVLVGVNRDELISRVSDAAPGRLSADSGLIHLALTTIAPLLAALLAISFDVSDLLHTWFGPIFQLVG
jgi:hypothetical protein